jgi:hypothetical protein
MLLEETPEIRATNLFPETIVAFEKFSEESRIAVGKSEYRLE